MSKPFIIYQEEIGPMHNFIYFVKDIKTSETIVVDPAWDVPRILEKVKNINGKLKHILLTHSHYDHINGVSDILEKYDIPVHLSKKENYCEEFKNIPLKLHHDGDKITIGQTFINILHTPGHTSGSVCYHLQNELITGDTMFIYGCGHCQSGGNPHQLFSSLQKLKKLPKKTTIHPGHNYAYPKTSMLEEQIKNNPFLVIKKEDAFVKYRSTIKRSTPYEPLGNAE